MPLPAPANGSVPGKTLHQRTKSTPAFPTLLQAGAVKAASKKVLGEANTNLKVVKDDSEIGKVSPGKAAVQEAAKPRAALGRPATRPVAPKSDSNQNMPSVTTTTTQTATGATMTLPIIGGPEPTKKVAPKKSTKVLREVQPSCDQDSKKPASAAPVHQTLAAPKPAPIHVDKPLAAVQQQEVRKTKSIPLRDQPAVRPVDQRRRRPRADDYATMEEYMHEDAKWNAIQMQSVIATYAYPEDAMYSLTGYHRAGYDGVPSSLPSAIANANAVPNTVPNAVRDEEEYYYDDGYTTGRSFGLRGESTGGITTILAPIVTDKSQEELAAARIFVGNTRSAEDIEDEHWDTSMVSEYGEDIFGYMRELEVRMAPNPRYMDQQAEIQWSMRAVLMDWIVQVHARFNLLPETLFLTVNYIDRFLSCKVVSLGKLQLVGATAIFIAAKYEEVQCPTINEIVYMVDGGYSADELLKAERFMLSMLQFELGWPGPMSFLRRISKADDYDLETRTLAKYFLEVTIMDERFVGCTPSFLAASAHCIARLMLRKGPWGPAHAYYSQYTYTQLHQLMAAVLECCENPQRHHGAVFDKYTDKRYKRASHFVSHEMRKGFALPGVPYSRSYGGPGNFDPASGHYWVS